VVLLEMLTGRRVFAGETLSDTMAAVLRAEIDFDDLPNGTPASIHHLLRRCLERDPRTRLQAIGEARIALEDDLEPLAEPISAAASPRIPTWVLGLGLVAAILTLIVGFAIGRGVGPEQQALIPSPVERFDLSLPADKPLAGGSFLKPFAISPDGSLVVYVGVEQGIRRLYKRPLDSLSVEQMPGTEGAEGPFFSPNGMEIGFWAQGAIKLAPLAGGLPRKIHATIDYRGATWGASATIVFAPSQGGPLWRISVDGSDVRVLTKLIEGEGGHRLPTFLPDGRTFVFGITAGRFSHETASVGIMSIDDDTHTILLDPSGLDIRYANDHLYHVQGNVLLAAPFDPVTRNVGSAMRVQEGIRVQANTGMAYFDIAPDGTLIYLPGMLAGDDGRIAWVDADGNFEFFSDERYILRHPSVLQDGQKMSVGFIGRERAGIWISDTKTPGFTRILPNVGVAWAPDGHHAAYSDITRGRVNWVDPFSNTEPEVIVEQTEDYVFPTSFSPDGSVLLLAVNSAGKDSNADIVAYHLEERSQEPFLATEHLEGGGQFSPDGKWVSFVSDQTGQFEVYIVAWPGGGNPRQISNRGGREPLWSADGRQVFYRNGTNMVAVSLGPGPGLQPEKPRILFEGPYEGLLGTIDSPNYAVHPDGRFLMLRSETLAAKMDRIAIARGVLPGS
jgi:Tol biopolymer transport system component